jgi:hypothetical protein
MGAPASRGAAYRWIVADLQHSSVARRWGTPNQENSALLSGVLPRVVIDQVAVVLEFTNLRFRASPLTSTSVVLTIHGDIFGTGNVPNTTVEELEERFQAAFGDADPERMDWI